MSDPKIKQLNLMVDNVLLQPEASTLFLTNWKNTNFSVWIKEIFLERFTKEKPPRYLKFWHITDDIVMGVIGNLLEVCGLISMNGRNVLSMRLSPGKYRSLWKVPDHLTNYNNANRQAMIIIEGQHISNDRIKCGAFIAIQQSVYNITTFIINTMNYLPAFRKTTETLENNKIDKRFYLTKLSNNLKKTLINKIIESICELNERHIEWETYRKSIKILKKNNKVEVNTDKNLTIIEKSEDKKVVISEDEDVTDEEGFEKKDSESKASKIWQDVISVKNTLNCVNCFDVKKDLSEEKLETR